MQHIPSPGFRVDTGPLKFGDDWCGYFFRGDEIPSDLLMYVAKLLEDEGGPDDLYVRVASRVRRLVVEMNRCQE